MAYGVTAAVVAAVVIAGTTYYTGEENRKAQGDAQRKAEDRASQQATQAKLEAENLKNSTANEKKTPDVNALIANAQKDSKGGVGGTFLTGSQGAGTGSLGKNTLLGS